MILRLTTANENAMSGPVWRPAPSRKSHRVPALLGGCYLVMARGIGSSLDDPGAGAGLETGPHKKTCGAEAYIFIGDTGGTESHGGFSVGHIRKFLFS